MSSILNIINQICVKSNVSVNDVIDEVRERSSNYDISVPGDNLNIHVGRFCTYKKLYKDP